MLPSTFRVSESAYPRGAYTRYTVATARELARRPEKLSVNDAGALGVAALTAWQGLFDHGHLKRGERLLIHGAADGVPQSKKDETKRQSVGFYTFSKRLFD
jgi:NADPH:quinone reductase-like Zn-dependent oxidoreductase